MSSVQNDIDQLLNTDMALKVLIKNKYGAPTNDITKSNNVWGYKWIDIPTNKDTMLGFKVGDPIKTTQFNEKITFLVLQKYNQAKTAEIAAALSIVNTTSMENISSPRIKFSLNGTITIDTKTHVNFSNPGSKTGDTSTDVNVSFYAGNLLSWDTKKIFSEDLKYILWFNDADSLYYLLYNPIHRENFKKYYRLSLLNGQVNISGDPIGNSEFHDVIVKYCNAFTVKGRRANMTQTERLSNPDIYSDPFCGVLMDRVTTALNSVWAMSITSSYYRNSFWPKTTTRDTLIEEIEKQIRKPGNYHSWACPFRGTAGSLVDFANSRNFFSQLAKKSFIADLARLDIAAHTSPHTTAQSAYNYISTPTTNSDDRLPPCGTGTTVNCTQILIANYGNVEGNQLSNECDSRIIESEKTDTGDKRTRDDTQNSMTPPGPTSGSTGPTSGSTSGPTSGSTSGSTLGSTGSTSGSTSASTPVSGTRGPDGLQAIRNTDIEDKTSLFKDWKPIYTYIGSLFKDWKPVYTYIVVAVLVVIIGIFVYFLIRKSNVSVGVTANSSTNVNVNIPSVAKPLEGVSTFGRYRYL